VNEASISEGVVDGDATVRYLRHLHVVTTEDGKNLVMSRKTPVDQKPLAPVLLVHGLGQNRFSWTLPKRSMENYLVSLGFETYNAELRGHGMSRAMGAPVIRAFEEYLDLDVPALLAAVQKISGREKAFYIGHSLGGTISYAAGPRVQDKLAGIVSIAGPFHFGRGNPWLRTPAWVAHTVEKLAKVPDSLLPRTLHVDSLGAFFRTASFALDHPAWLVPLQLWHPRSMEPEILKHRLSIGMDHTGFSLVRYFLNWAGSGKFRSSCGTRDFEAQVRELSVPLLFVNGDRDYSVPPSSALGAFQAAKSQDKTFHVFGKKIHGHHFGHLDLIVGRHAPAHVWPVIGEWMKKRV